MINVTKTYLPSLKAYTELLEPVWETAWITNNGPLLQQLENDLRLLLKVEHFYITNNGTTSLLLALKALGITKQVITTPYSYVATLNAILWQGCTPVFVDIDPFTMNMDASKIEDAITTETEAILATHVYGFPCAVEQIEAIALKHQLKVIYDGAHAFSVNYQGRSLLSYGDVTTCSFHATKLFHMAEGGAVTCNDEAIARKVELARSFGHEYDEYYTEGINGKNSELHAAMGLSVLPHVDELIAKNKKLIDYYHTYLSKQVHFQTMEMEGLEWNYSYCPVLFANEREMLHVKEALNREGIFPRRYFYPALNTVPYLSNGSACPVAENIASRVLALPLYYALPLEEADRIIRIIQQQL